MVQSQRQFHCIAAGLMHAGVQCRCCMRPCEILLSSLSITWNWAASLWWFFSTMKHRINDEWTIRRRTVRLVMFMIFLLSISDPPTDHPTNHGEFQISTDQGDVFMSSSFIGTCTKCNFKFNPPQAMWESQFAPQQHFLIRMILWKYSRYLKTSKKSPSNSSNILQPIFCGA